MKFHITLFALLISINSFSQLPNPDFETWTNNSFSIPDPDGWGTFNYGSVTCSQYQPAQHGTYAMKLQNTVSLPGIVTCYFPFTQSPAALDGFYLGQFAAGDIFDAVVNLYDSAMNPVAEGSFITALGPASYTSFSIPLNYISTNVPDTAILSLSFQSASPANITGYVVIDNLSFSGTVDINENKNNFYFSFGPNPVANILTINFANSDEIIVQVSDVTGKIVINSKQSTTDKINRVDVDVSQLNDGIYYLRLNDGKNSITKPFVKHSQ